MGTLPNRIEEFVVRRSQRWNDWDYINEARPDPYAYEDSVSSGLRGLLLRISGPGTRSSLNPGLRSQREDVEPWRSDIPTRWLCELVGKVLTEAAASDEGLASSFQFSSQYSKFDGIDDSAVRHGRLCGRTTVNSAFVRAVRPGYRRFVDSIFEALPPTRRNPGPRQPIRSLSRVWSSRRPVMCPRSG